MNRDAKILKNALAGWIYPRNTRSFHSQKPILNNRISCKNYFRSSNDIGLEQKNQRTIDRYNVLDKANLCL